MTKLFRLLFEGERCTSEFMEAPPMIYPKNEDLCLKLPTDNPVWQPPPHPPLNTGLRKYAATTGEGVTNRKLNNCSQQKQQLTVFLFRDRSFVTCLFALGFWPPLPTRSSTAFFLFFAKLCHSTLYSSLSHDTCKSHNRFSMKSPWNDVSRSKEELSLLQAVWQKAT
jgi:hypothetical protein